MTSHYPNGFANGVSVRGLPLLNTYGGNVYWVNSATGSDGNKGTRERPFATLDYAIGRCTANNGDIIMVAPNHAETITGAGGITADVAGITIIGLGHGNQRPRFLMDGATTVTFAISAADVSVENCVFAAGHADIVTCFAITAAFARLDRIEFVNNVADENFLTEIKVTSTTDNAGDGLIVTNCRAMTIDANAVEFLEINGDLDGMVFNGNFISKDAAQCQGIVCATGKDLTNCQVMWNLLITGETDSDLLIDNDTTANSGIVAHNRIGHHDTAGEVLVDCDGVRQFDNLGTATDTASGFILPAIDS